MPPRSQRNGRTSSGAYHVNRILALILACTALPALAQTYPTKPVRFIVPFAAGGGSDLVARTVAQKLTEALGQTVVVDNRTGAAGSIGAELAAKSPPDGHTLLLGSNGPLAINPHLYPKLPYDAVRDFAPVALVTVMPFLLVTHPALPVRSVKDLIALAKSRPGQLPCRHHRCPSTRRSRPCGWRSRSHSQGLWR